MSTVLVIYKKSMYQIYFRERREQVRRAHHLFSAETMARWRAADAAHAASLELVRHVLRRHHVAFRSIYRARHVDLRPYDLVVAVGGDGTFLEAARRLTTQTILGVNSDPDHSVGVFCPVTADGFGALFEQVQAGTARLRRLQRMALRLNGETQPFMALNDVLVAHGRPAALSRYFLTVGDVREPQRGSGLWVSTAAGSTGAIYAAGGRRLPLGSRRLQYWPRELNRPPGVSYRLTGGMVNPGVPLVVESEMREGAVFVDGCHLRLSLPYGARLELSLAPYPLRIVVGPVSNGGA